MDPDREDAPLVDISSKKNRVREATAGGAETEEIEEMAATTGQFKYPSETGVHVQATLATASVGHWTAQLGCFSQKRTVRRLTIRRPCVSSCHH